MRRYKVTIPQTFVHTVEVEAFDEDDAISLAADMVAGHSSHVGSDNGEIDQGMADATKVFDDGKDDDEDEPVYPSPSRI